MATINPVNRGTGWSNARLIPQIAESDGTYSEGIAALLRGWNTTSLAYQKISVNNGSGGLEVHIVGGSTTATVSATDLDIRNLSSGQDSVTAVQGNGGSSAWLVKEERAAAATVTSVPDAATSAQLLAANTARKGFRIYNDSTVVLYVKYGATATTADYSVKLDAGGFLSENDYTGRVDGIWASDAAGAAKVTEL